MTELPPWSDPSPGSLVVFLLVVAVVVGVFLWAARSAGLGGTSAVAGLAVWLGASGLLAGTGALHPGPFPPPLMLFVAVCIAAAVGLAFSPVGRRLADATPLAVLVGVQGFRLPLELVLHRWHDEGIVPVQMTFEGLNFDIVTGVLSLIVGGILAARPRSAMAAPAAWIGNVVGAVLLLGVMGLAMTSAPGPLFRFTDAPPLQLPLHFPTVWIVSVCVTGALFFHLVTFRALLAPRDEASARRGVRP